MEASRLNAVEEGSLASVRRVVADYVALTKPKVQSLLILTTVAAMLIAGDPSIQLILLTCIGGYLSAGGAGAVNHWYDRDIDLQMERTATRPVASGRVSPTAALVFGFALALASLVEMWIFVNPLAALLAFSGFIGYALIYTVWLKRSTPQNIVLGGAAGAIPPLVGWAAVTGSLSLAPIYLFAIVFYWTPPHFWALSLLMKDEYAKVGVPMMPVVRGEEETRRQIVLYTTLLIAVTILPVFGGLFGAIYLVPAIILDAIFMVLALSLQKQATRPAALKLYLYSLGYLALLFAAMVVDSKI